MMKTLKTLLCLALFLVSTIAQAIPAKRELIKVQQPDGTTLTICLQGDEWTHFTTTADGYTVLQDEQGYYVYAQKDNDVLKATKMVAHDADKREKDELAFVAKTQKRLAPMTDPQTSEIRNLVVSREKKKLMSRRAAKYDYNNFKGLIILVQFTDQQFSRSDFKTIMTDMVNKEGYTGYINSNGKKEEYTGSVRDYFSDNSNGKFKPEFDIVGPYTINFKSTDAKCGYQPGEPEYDPIAPKKIAYAALNAADKDVNFKQYDGDGDGYVDLIYFIFAGNGSNYSGNDKGLWWPHRSVVFNPSTYSYIRKDGVTLLDYASSTELYGFTSAPSTITIDGIGTICHEFSHVLGLPDFYDADYTGSGGESNDPGEWSLMGNGSYFNYSRTPVGYSLYERYAVGFTEEPPVITGKGNYTLNPLYSSYTGYRLDTPEPKEFFLFENRQQNLFKWDKYLPGSGMLVHRVDYTNEAVWSMSGDQANQVNVNPAHNYYEVVRADGPHTSYGAYISSDADVFPGSKNKTSLTNVTSPASLKTWKGYNNQFGLTNIRQNTNGNITFTVAGYEPTLLEIDKTLNLTVGTTQKLEPSVQPSYAVYTLTWKSDNESVATVDSEGVVTGVGVGTCTITVTTDNNLTATCAVTVTKPSEYDIATFKQLPADTEAMLTLNNAQVLFSYTKSNVTTTYLREGTEAIMLYDSNINVQAGNLITGTLYVKKQAVNNVPQADGMGSTPSSSSLTITKGGTVKPRTVKFEELNASHYSDLVTIKGAKLMRSSNRIYAYSDQNSDERVRIWAGNFSIASGISSTTNLDNKYFNVTGIYGTYLQDSEVFNELDVTMSVKDVTNEFVGIKEVRNDSKSAESSQYNLSGQRVGNDYKGIIIRNGKKTIKR